MKVIIRGDNVKITDAINKFVNEKVERLEKYFKDDELEVKVNLKVLKVGQKAEITINFKKMIFRSEEIQGDLYAAIDVAIDKLEGQIKRNKNRLIESNRGSKEGKAMFLEMIKEEDVDDEVKIIKRKNLIVGPMSDEEALLQIELIDHDFFIYKDVDTPNIKVIYKRRDEKYGIIEVE